jgi:hypothetical protein
MNLSSGRIALNIRPRPPLVKAIFPRGEDFLDAVIIDNDDKE